MPLYYYEALGTGGKKSKGIIESESEKEAKAKLRERGLMVTLLSTKVKISPRENLKTDALLTFTIQLSQLINAGVPLYQSLMTIEEQTRGEKYHRILLSLCDQIKGGSSLSDAMMSYPDSFGRLYVAMVAAGEASGALGLVLERQAHFLKKQTQLKKEIGNALIYPLILASFSLIVIGVLLGFVVPSIEGIFEGRELNSFTRLVLNLSYVFRSYWTIYIPLILGIVGLLVWQLNTDKGKERFQRFFMKVPIVRTLMIESGIARFSRTMATLLRGGLPFVEALRFSKEVMNNRVMEEELIKAEGKILEGSSLSKEIKKSRTFPSLVSRMLSVGEETGSVPKMLESIANMYEESLEKSLSRVVALAQPVILIIMGGVIGLVMVAILLPMSDIAAFTGS